MAVEEKTYTVDDLLALSRAGKRYELIRGELVDMSPTGDLHTELSLWLGKLILDHVVAHRLGVVSGADGGYEPIRITLDKGLKPLVQVV